jgi:uncharacterized protein YndB with AHSA1/START domain
MRNFSGTASTDVPADPAAVFATITDIDALPQWNAAIERVVERPADLLPGASWTVTMHPPHVPRWNSVSTLEVLDPDALRFRYRTQHASGNPSFVVWSWSVTPHGSGAEVTVTWDCTLSTVDRRWFGGPIRKRQLDREVPHSLAALAALLRAIAPHPHD